MTETPIPPDFRFVPSVAAMGAAGATGAEFSAAGSSLDGFVNAAMSGGTISRRRGLNSRTT